MLQLPWPMPHWAQPMQKKDFLQLKPTGEATGCGPEAKIVAKILVRLRYESIEDLALTSKFMQVSLVT